MKNKIICFKAAEQVALYPLEWIRGSCKEDVVHEMNLQIYASLGQVWTRRAPQRKNRKKGNAKNTCMKLI
jgi:hypothetical protein